MLKVFLLLNQRREDDLFKIKAGGRLYDLTKIIQLSNYVISTKLTLNIYLFENMTLLYPTLKKAINPTKVMFLVASLIFQISVLLMLV